MPCGPSTGQGRDRVAAYAEVVTGVLDALGLPAGSGPAPLAESAEGIARSTAVPGAGSHGPAAVFAGHSMGGAIALWLALHQPERVRALVLAGTGAKLRVHPDILQAAKEGRPVGSAAVLGGQTSSSARPPTAAPEVVYGDWVACDTFNVMDRLGEIHVPTLVLVGANDMMTPPKYAGFLAQGIKGASLVTIEGAGHSPMLDKPAEVAAVIQRFIDSLQAGA